MECLWKPNWEETKKHFIDWWHHRGLVIGMWGAPATGNPHESLPQPPEAKSVEESFTNPVFRAQRSHYQMANQTFIADTLPLAETHLGPGSLALFLGATPGFSTDTIWFHPSIQDCEDPESLPPLVFDPENQWWKLTEATIKESLKLSRGKYMVECPDLVENMDILAALRDPQVLLMDMIERPEWIEEKMVEISAAWCEVYQRVYDLIKRDDGSSNFGAFRLWGPGKVAKVQCDLGAMISPRMFRRFVVPELTKQCAWLDYSMFHLDGHQCLCHLDALLEIQELTAIEWTPDPNVPPGGDPHWYPLYRRILEAGKSVQALGVKPHEIKPLINAVGKEGLYIITDFTKDEDVRYLEEYY